MTTSNTSLGLDENLAAVLAYSLGWLSGAAMLLAERDNRFVRFHAWQSTILFSVLCCLWFIGWSIPLLGWLFVLFVLTPVSAVLWLLLLFKAYQGEWFKVPFVGEIAERRA